MSNREEIINELKNAGYEIKTIAGIISNMYYESGYNPNINGDSNTSYGLCQWHAGRKTKLQTYCSTNGLDYTTIKGQIKYLDYELKTFYKNVYAKIVNASTPFEAGYYFCKNFEIPANTEFQSIKRGNYAETIYKEININISIESTPFQTYEIGKVYSTQVILKVRNGPGLGFSQINYSNLSTNGKENAYKTGVNKGCFKKGTRITCLETKVENGNVWIRCPSGWIAGFYNNNLYVK